MLPGLWGLPGALLWRAKSVSRRRKVINIVRAIIKMKTILDNKVREELAVRIERIAADAKAHWGRMNVHQMICHLTDQLRDLDGSRPVNYQGNPVTRHVLRHLLQKIENWPKGVFPSNSDYDQLKGGTRPVDFN